MLRPTQLGASPINNINTWSVTGALLSGSSRGPIFVAKESSKNTSMPLACLGNPDPVDMRVFCPDGEETFKDDKTTEEAPPEEIVAKLRDDDVMHNADKHLAVVL